MQESVSFWNVQILMSDQYLTYRDKQVSVNSENKILPFQTHRSTK